MYICYNSDIRDRLCPGRRFFVKYMYCMYLKERLATLDILYHYFEYIQTQNVFESCAAVPADSHILLLASILEAKVAHFNLMLWCLLVFCVRDCLSSFFTYFDSNKNRQTMSFLCTDVLGCHHPHLRNYVHNMHIHDKQMLSRLSKNQPD